MNTLHIGVTGMSRAGKTVFITSLIHHLVEGTAASLDKLKKKGIEYWGRADRLALQRHKLRAPGSIGTPFGGLLPRLIGNPNLHCMETKAKELPYERYMVSFRDNPPEWPPSTTEAYVYRLHLEYRNLGGNKKGRKRTVAIELFDYPGEFLVDVRLSYQHWDTWSDEVIRRLVGQRHFR